MNSQIKPKVLIVEGDRAIARKAETVLAASGWQVVIESAADQALEQLKQPMSSPFALFISGFELGGSDGGADGISLLESVKALSPITRRMLWIPHDKPDALIDAVNTVSINACITYPINGQELSDQTDNCLKQFKQRIKQTQFKTLISKHNKKMFELAKNLKRKDQANRLLLDEKKSKRSRLEFKQRKLTGNTDQMADISLAKLIFNREVPKDPDVFLDLFRTMIHTMKGLVQSLADKNEIQWEPQGLPDILDEELQSYSHPGVLENFIKTVYIASLDRPLPKIPTPLDESASGLEDSVEKQIELIEDYLELIIEDNGTSALLKKKKDPTQDQFLELNLILSFLGDQGIFFGIVDDSLIEKWIASAGVEDEGLIVAKAELPVLSKDGSIEYYFESEYTNPGKVREDGSIDFHDRGDVPFVEKGSLLARKTAPESGRNGVSVLDEDILVEEPLDPSFLSGHGTLLSDDGLTIFADEDGQPHLDPMGSITVNPEMMVNGDVDFETGNIDFQGNIVIRGTIKQGFSIKGVNLTANEIEGATISLSGELNISSGITDADIQTVGNIHTKFIHNSTILGFGDFTVQNEIIDSEILLSGTCQVPTGHIIASKISAKKGIHAGKIGTPSSLPPKLKVGAEKHIVEMIRKNKIELTSSLEKIEKIQAQIRTWVEEDIVLGTAAAEKAKIQEICQDKIVTLKKKYLQAKEAADATALPQLTSTIKEMFAKTRAAGNDLHGLFEDQDRLRQKSHDAKKIINRYEERNIILVDEKKSLVEYADRGEPDPSVTVYKSIVQGTAIQGLVASITLTEDMGPSKIEEIQVTDGNRKHHEMSISPLNK